MLRTKRSSHKVRGVSYEAGRESMTGMICERRLVWSHAPTTDSTDCIAIWAARFLLFTFPHYSCFFGSVRQIKLATRINGPPFPLKIPLSHTASGPHLIHDSLGSSEPKAQTVSRSVQPFLHNSPQCPYTLQWVTLFLKIASSRRGDLDAI